MRTTLAALASVSATFASVVPESYAKASASTTCTDDAASSTLADAAGSTGDFPSCWASCFTDAAVAAPHDACGDDKLTSCIEKACSEDDAESYAEWYAEECGTSTNTVNPIGSTTLSHGPSGYPTTSGLTGYPHGPSSYKPSGTASASGHPGGYGNCTTTYSSVCTETETLIYRDTTEYEPTTITHIFTTSLPAASCSGVLYPVTSSSSVQAPPPYDGADSSTPSSPEQPGETPPTYGGSQPSTPSSPEQPGESLPSYGGSEPPSPSSPEQPGESPPTYGGSHPSSPSSPEEPAEPTVTDYTTIYTTVCPVTETATEGDNTVTKIYETTSVVTSVYETTITAPADGSPTGGSDGGSGGNGGNGGHDASVGNGGSPSKYTSLKPVTKPFTYGDWTSYFTDFETVTLTSYVTDVESATDGSAVPSSTKQTCVYHTDVTTEYTTVGPVTDGESTGLTTSTITTTSTVDLTFTVTTTDGPDSYPSPTNPAEGDATAPYPTPSDSASKPATGYPTGGQPTGSASSSYPSDPESPSTTSSAVPTTSGSPQPPIPDCWAQCFGKYNVTSQRELCSDLEVETCIKAECPADSYKAYDAWHDDYCGVASTSSGVVGPTGSGYPQPTSSNYPQPSGSGYPNPSGTGPVGTGPAGTGTTGPTGTPSSTCALPTPTKACRRCEGQPGTDKFCGLDVHSNIYKDDGAPITCNTVEYNWEITEGIIAPDGVSRLAILINGQSPGPMLKASWGDEIIVHVKNSLPVENLNGTTIHWHGVHQKYTSEFDGTPSLTQCPIAPGETFTYKFRATQYGSSWYHSHFALQAYEGLYGPLVIDGPLQEGIEYDGEEFVALQDWRHRPLNEIYHQLELVQNGQRSSPTLDNALINGKNTFNGRGERWSMNVEKGKTYRLRVLNAAIQSTFKFYIDGHSFKVIAADFVPIEPYETNIININNGQRYDVIFTADQDVGNYWMRSDVQAPCSNVTNGLDVKGIVHYEGADDAEPNSQAYTYRPECIDEAPENLVPIVPWNAGQSADTIDKDVVIVPNGGNPNLFKWTLSGTAFFSQWNDPTLQSIYDDGTVPTYSGDLAIREDNLGEWIYVVIDSPIPLPHPIHLHGHDFLVLDQGFGLYNAATASLNLQNPPRRDTAIMPFQPGVVGGYLVVAFYTDNPGVWLMHCHIGWVSLFPPPLVAILD